MIKRSILGTILKLPLFGWVLLGFLATYLLFFIRPVFFSAQVMQFFKYLPAMDPIGLDLKNTLRTAQALFSTGQNPYIANSQYAYPPLTSLLVAPLLIVNASLAYEFVTLFIVFCYGMTTFVFPLLVNQARSLSPALLLVFITGLFSYGLQFELERGQFNLIAVFLVFLAVWIYHYRTRYRWLAYILFILSVQLKVYPLIFIVMFIDDWQAWKNNLKRLAGLMAANFALFFALGPALFVDFVKALLSQTTDPGVWTGNHSIHSFVTLYFKLASDAGWGWLTRYAGGTQIAILLIIIFFIFLVLLRTYRQNQKGLAPLLLLACSLGALLIPSASHDYTLSFLAAPVAVLFAQPGFWKRPANPRRQLLMIEMLFIFSVAYSSTLVSYIYKPLSLNNDFPALVIMLVVVTLLSFMSPSIPPVPDDGNKNIDSKPSVIQPKVPTEKIGIR